MAYICMDCGHIFEEGEQKAYRNDCKEHHGVPCFEIFGCCPICGGEYLPTLKCECCGKETLEEELDKNCGICDECVESYIHDLEMCKKISEKCEDDEVKLNPLLTSVFSKKEIESILFDILKKRTESDDWAKSRGFEEFADGDIAGFAWELIKILKGGKEND